MNAINCRVDLEHSSSEEEITDLSTSQKSRSLKAPMMMQTPQMSSMMATRTISGVTLLMPLTDLTRRVLAKMVNRVRTRSHKTKSITIAIAIAKLEMRTKT